MTRDQTRHIEHQPQNTSREVWTPPLESTVPVERAVQMRVASGVTGEGLLAHLDGTRGGAVQLQQSAEGDCINNEREGLEQARERALRLHLTAIASVLGQVLLITLPTERTRDVVAGLTSGQVTSLILEAGLESLDTIREGALAKFIDDLRPFIYSISEQADRDGAQCTTPLLTGVLEGAIELRRQIVETRRTPPEQSSDSCNVLGYVSYAAYCLEHTANAPGTSLFDASSCPNGPSHDGGCYPDPMPFDEWCEEQ